MRYEQSHFYDELKKMLAEAKTSGKTTLRVVSQDLYDRAVPYVHHRVMNRDEQDEYMEYACKAMWRLWEKQGYQKRKMINVVHRRQQESSEVLELEFDTH